MSELIVLGAGGTAEQCRDSLQPLLELLGVGDLGLGSTPLPNLPLGPSAGVPATPPLPDLPDVDGNLLNNLGNLLSGSLGGAG